MKFSNVNADGVAVIVQFIGLLQIPYRYNGIKDKPGTSFIPTYYKQEIPDSCRGAIIIFPKMLEVFKN